MNKTLKRLHLYKNQICDKGAKHWADALEENETRNNIDDEGAKNIIANCLYKNLV